MNKPEAIGDCGQCSWWVATDGDTGECRQRPPVVIPTGSGPVTVFPTMHKSGWCAEYNGPRADRPVRGGQ